MPAGTVLVTGATGFIGRWAAKALVERGFTVHCVAGRGSAAIPSELVGAHLHRADLLDRSTIGPLIESIRPSHLLHFAWVTTPGKYGSSPENLSWTAASLDLARAFKEAGGKRLIVAGSCAEYDWTRANVCKENETPLVVEANASGTLYAISKASLFKLLSAYAAQSGLSLAWGRVFFQFGPYEHRQRLVSSVILSLLKGEPALCTHGRQVRGFLSSMDAGDAFAALAACELEGAFNISTTDRYSVASLVTKIGEIVGRPELIQLGAREAPPGEPAMLVADTTRLNKEVGWRPGETLEGGLAKTIDWWRTNLSTHA